MSAAMIGPHWLRGMLASFALAMVLLAPSVSGSFAQDQSAGAGVSAPAVVPPPPAEGQGAATVPVAAAPPEEEKLSDAQLEQLVAPIALHPDSLLAQILTAATYPLEVEMAARWSKGKSRASRARNSKTRCSVRPGIRASRR